MKRLVYAFLICALCAVSCVYPYDAEIGGGSGDLVIEGDIFVGAMSEFALSTLLPVSASNASRAEMAHPYGVLWVEDSNGIRYYGVAQGDGVYSVDMTDAKPGPEYRLRVDISGGRSYASSWMHGAGTCYADDLTCSISADRKKLQLLLSMHSDEESSRHFRYRYSEDWEFHTIKNAVMYYDPNAHSVEYYSSGDVTNYFCWNHEGSRGINLATTEDMTGTELIDFPIRAYGNNDRRFSYIYRIILEIYSVSEESYDYYEHLKEMSEYDGSLFAPTPSEVRGNIRCLDDDDEIVYGYVAVAEPARIERYFYSKDLKFFVDPDDRISYEDKTFPEYEWYMAYMTGWRPYYNKTMVGVLWTNARCVDCRKLGGTKQRPENWINEDR